ncbi:MAG: hypothetical protein JKX94_08275 [Sneathiella sp.]|nr:hypothetical protein [Sneathiella sp.]
MNQTVQLAYVNPETGAECLPILGFSAIKLRPGEQITYTRRSCSSVFHIIEGEGSCEVDGKTLDWQQRDTLAIPTHARVNVLNKSSKKPAYLIVIDDAPLHRKLGIYEQFSV